MMQIYALQITEFEDSWLHFCFAESRRKAIALFRADIHCANDMKEHSHIVGTLEKISPETLRDDIVMRALRDRKSIRLIDSQSINSRKPTVYSDEDEN